jgi:hypothetical protein|tara:strand:+ start:1648 stop:2016 length:369 start_codon:yes stop_codon:yes gene_type:complete
MFAAILGPVAGLAKTWIEGKQKKAQLKSQVELTKLEATKKQIEKDGNWSEKAMEASADSWKDEAWTLTFIAIIFASFVPALQPFMQQGFLFLKNDCPEWISYGILASIAGSFGLKGIAKMKK